LLDGPAEPELRKWCDRLIGHRRLWDLVTRTQQVVHPVDVLHVLGEVVRAGPRRSFKENGHHFGSGPRGMGAQVLGKAHCFLPRASASPVVKSCTWLRELEYSVKASLSSHMP
jgi:hypothetical protein